jgi:hypothetical protein
VRGKHNKLGEGERKVRLGQDSLPNIAISVAETSGNYIHCFTQTPHWAFAIKYFAARGSGTEVEHLTHFPKGKCSNTANGKRREEVSEYAAIKILILPVL